MIEHMTIHSRGFNKVYFDKLKDDTALQIFFGGSSSGKSVFLAQRCVIDVMQGNRNYLCVRNVKATIRNSMFNEILKAIVQFKAMADFKINRSDLVITCQNGYQILFAGLDDVEKIKSISPALEMITDIWVEEATEIMPNDLKQLQRRLRGHTKYSKRVTMSFNPILQSHWIFKKYFGKWEEGMKQYIGDGLSILKTTYKDNKFLDVGDIKLLEDETDKYYRDVYTLGNWGVLGSVIFKNWEVRDLHNEFVNINGKQTCIIDTFDNYKNGLDFGFSIDPNAMIRTHFDKKHKTIYVVDELYEREMTNDVLAEVLKPIIGKEYIYCDNSDPRSITDLRQSGIQSLATKKGKDSINFGIDWLLRQHIIIDIRCQNFKNEIQQYKWKEDKDGNALRVPVDKNNHLLDAIRYAYESESMYGDVKAVRAFY